MREQEEQVGSTLHETKQNDTKAPQNQLLESKTNCNFKKSTIKHETHMVMRQISLIENNSDA